MSTLIKKRAKLAALYLTGVEVRIGPDDTGRTVARLPESGTGFFLDDAGEKLPPPGEDDPEIALWVQPPNPLEREQALRYAQGARAACLLRVKRDMESEDHLTAMAFIADMSDDTLADYVLQQEGAERLQEAQRDVLADDEWENVTQLQDALAGFDENPPQEGTEEYKDYQRLLDLDAKFADQVTAREKELRETARDVFAMKPREVLEKDALAKRGEIVATQAFMADYDRWMLFYSVRDMEEGKPLPTYFFADMKDLASSDHELLHTLRGAMQQFISDAGEAKNSQRVADGSEPSPLPSEPETSESSIPQEPNA